MNPFSMVVTDWDMTLAPFPGMELGTRTVRVLTELSSRGVHIVLASGRPAGGLANLAKFNQLDMETLHLIGSNGATASRATSPHDYIFALPLPPEAVLAARRFAKKNDLEFLIPTPHAIYTSKPLGLYTLVESATADTETAPIGEWTPDLATAMKAQVITHGMNDAKALSGVRKAIAKSGAEAEVVFSAPGLLEVNAVGAHKGAMLARLCEHLGVPLDSVVAFGDNHNDVTLLEAAEVGYAVGDAVPELRDVATEVIGNVEDEAEAAKLSEIFALA